MERSWQLLYRGPKCVEAPVPDCLDGPASAPRAGASAPKARAGRRGSSLDSRPSQTLNLVECHQEDASYAAAFFVRREVSRSSRSHGLAS